MSITFSTCHEGTIADGRVAIFHDTFEHEVNLSGSNARLMLLELGLTEYADDYCGTIDPKLMLAACNVYMAMAPRYGREFGNLEEEGGRWVTCGHRPGYFHDTAARLIALAEHAIEVGKNIGYS